MRIRKEDTSCLVIDYQERLMPVMADREELIANSARLLKGLKILEIPMAITGQYCRRPSI